MSIARHAKQRDANEAAIVLALHAAGCLVWRLDQPVDLLVYRRRDPAWFLLEVKLPPGPRGGTGSSKLTAGQRKFFALAPHNTAVVRTPIDALEAVGVPFEVEPPRTCPRCGEVARRYRCDCTE